MAITLKELEEFQKEINVPFADILEILIDHLLKAFYRQPSQHVTLWLPYVIDLKYIEDMARKSFPKIKSYEFDPIRKFIKDLPDQNLTLTGDLLKALIAKYPQHHEGGWLISVTDNPSSRMVILGFSPWQKAGSGDSI